MKAAAGDCTSMRKLKPVLTVSAEVEAAQRYVQATYPHAHTYPLGAAYAKGFWVLSGTGYTLAAGRTEDEAWMLERESCCASCRSGR